MAAGGWRSWHVGRRWREESVLAGPREPSAELATVFSASIIMKHVLYGVCWNYKIPSPAGLRRKGQQGVQCMTYPILGPFPSLASFPTDQPYAPVADSRRCLKEGGTRAQWTTEREGARDHKDDLSRWTSVASWAFSEPPHVADGDCNTRACIMKHLPLISS